MKKSWVIVVAVAWASLSGCKKDPADGSGGWQGVGSVSSYECESQADCTISCAAPGDCCGQLCECTRPYHKKALSETRKANRARCGKRRDCPQADCPRPEHDYVPRCEAGKCVAEKVPRFRALSPAPQCTGDEDCEVACDEPNECCADNCGCNHVYHKDVLAKIREVNGQRCTEEELGQCSAAKCSRPEKNTIAVCNQGRCEAKLVPWDED